MVNKILLSESDLKKHLDEQLHFIELSCESFDSGFESESKRIAVSIRILLHDTNSSHSLLKQLNMKKINFYDSAIEYNERSQAPHHGLIWLATAPPKNRYVAMMDGTPSKFIRKVNFDEWWNKVVLVDVSKNRLSRKDLILIATNQDGGAHIDPKLNKIYANIARENSIGWKYHTPNGDTNIEGPERASIRQIAHEILKTLRPGYEKKLDIKAGVFVTGLQIGSVEDFPNIRSHHKVGRNDRCPCGSGKKYKYCHGR